MEVKKFILGKDKTPDWFNEQALHGRTKINMEDGEIINAIVYSPVGTKTAKPGDVIMLLKSGMSVVPGSKAVKYGVKKEADI